MPRIVFSIAFFRQKLPVQLVSTSTKSRWKFYTQVRRRSFHTAWVKRRNTHCEQIFSALPPRPDMAGSRCLVRFVLPANSRHRPTSFDRLVSSGKQRRRYDQAKCLGSPKVDDQIEFGGLFHRQI